MIEACKECSHELNSISSERIWQETLSALEAEDPTRYFTFLINLKIDWFFKEIFDLEEVSMINDYHQEANAFVHTLMVINEAKKRFNNPKITFAALMHDLGKAYCYQEKGNLHGHEKEGVPIVKDFCYKYKVPNEYRDLALMTTEHHLKIHNCLGRGKNKPIKPSTLVKLFKEVGALSKPERFKNMLKACEADAAGRIGIGAKDKYIQRSFLEECLDGLLNHNTKKLTKKLLEEGKSGLTIGQSVHESQINVIKNIQNKWKIK